MQLQQLQSSMMRGQKSWKNQTSTTQTFFNFSQNIDNQPRKSSIKRKYGVTEHLRELNPCTDIKVPTGDIYLHISSTARELNAWCSTTLRVNYVHSKHAQIQLVRTSLNRNESKIQRTLYKNDDILAVLRHQNNRQIRFSLGWWKQ